MAFVEIGGGDIRYPKYANYKDGDLLVEGKYNGTKEGTYGIQHLFTDSEGEVVLGKAGHLDYLMSQVNPGSYVQVFYGGQEVLKKGAYKGKLAHRFRVLVDNEKDGVPFEEE